MTSEHSQHKYLTLEVSDFGPIAQGTIELRPLTVFVGPSNTGKSYLAILIYAFHKYWAAYSSYARMMAGLPLSLPFRRIRIPSGITSGQERQHKAVANEIQEWINGLGTVDRNNREDFISVPSRIASRALETIGTFDNYKALWEEIELGFGANMADLIRHRKPGVTISIRHSDNDLAEPFMLESRYSNGNSTGSIYYPDNMTLQVQRQTLFNMMRFFADEPTNRRNRERNAEQVTFALANLVIARLIAPLDSPSYYLPADRGGVMHAHQVVVRSLIRSAARGGLRDESPLPALSGVLADFLEELISITNRSGRRTPPKRLAQEMERSILQGTIQYEESAIEYPSFSYQPSGWKQALPLMNTSSMVSELAPVVLYLRHVVQSEDTLIIEEPEAHLHPAMQREFTRQIAAIVRAGIRVIITTHSEWVLEELANLVYLSNVPREHTNDIEDLSSALDKDQVGVWLFERKNRPRGSVIREIPLNVDTGSFDSGFDAVSRDLYNKWADITSLVNGEN